VFGFAGIRINVAKDLGCSANALREWAKRDDLDAGRRDDGLTSAEREELARLRRQIRVVTEERDILAKATLCIKPSQDCLLDGKGSAA
jgi:transposase